MIHLVQDSVSHIEDNLLWVKHVRDKLVSWWFNATILVVVVGSFFFFMYASYGTAVPEELTKIPFEPRMWNNAVRNVPMTEYGQLPKTETPGGIQGFTHRTSAVTF
jgi:hypothetical protein